MRESQHAADHMSVFDRPSQVADLRPAVFIFHFHHALRDGQLLSGSGDYRPQPHLLYLFLIHLTLFGESGEQSDVFL